MDNWFYFGLVLHIFHNGNANSLIQVIAIESETELILTKTKYKQTGRQQIEQWPELELFKSHLSLMTER